MEFCTHNKTAMQRPIIPKHEIIEVVLEFFINPPCYTCNVSKWMSIDIYKNCTDIVYQNFGISST